MKTITTSILLIILTISSFNAQVRIIGTDPNQGLIMLKNFGTTAVDITKYTVCSKSNCKLISTLNVVAGKPADLPAGQSTWINGFTMNAAGGDIALFLPETKGEGFKNVKNLVDYMQWKTAGNEREKLAVQKGIWKSGTYILGNPSYTFKGRIGNEQGVEFFNSVAITPEENSLENQVSVHPNKTGTTITIETIQNIKVKSYKLVDASGKVIFEKANITQQDDIVLDVSKLPRGDYNMYVDTAKGTITRKVLLKN